MTSTKDRIITAAIALFAEHGYSNTGMRSIAEAVNIKPASIYSHFESKSEILDVILLEYTDYVRRCTVQPDEVDALMDQLDARSILQRMFFTFEPATRERYLQMLKIIMHEQFRESQAGNVMRDNMLKGNYDYIRGVLDKLVEKEKIPPVETGIYARLFVSLLVASSSETIHYGFYEQRSLQQESGSDAIRFLIDQILATPLADGSA